MRLFIAIPLPDELKERLAALQQRGKARGIQASWPDPRGLHLTLAFLGETPEAEVPRRWEVTRTCAAGHPAFGLRTQALGGFPSDRRARVLWLGLEEPPSLLSLCRSLRQGLKDAGCSFDEKPFKAHLTLARLKAPIDIGRFGESPEAWAFEARELTLFQSVTTAAGAQYRVIGAATLG